LRNESTLNAVGKVLPKDRTKTLIAIQKRKVHENYPKGEPSNHQDHHWDNTTCLKYPAIIENGELLKLGFERRVDVKRD